MLIPFYTGLRKTPALTENCGTFVVVLSHHSAMLLRCFCDLLLMVIR